jgi:hypothetical protein
MTNRELFERLIAKKNPEARLTREAAGLHPLDWHPLDRHPLDPRQYADETTHAAWVECRGLALWGSETPA